MLFLNSLDFEFFSFDRKMANINGVWYVQTKKSISKFQFYLS